MSERDVSHLVAEYAGKLGVRPCAFNQAAMDEDVATGDSERVHGRVVNEVEVPIARCAVGHTRDSPADRCEVGIRLGVAHDRQLRS